MTEKEKAKLGMLYNPNFDEQLIRERNEAKQICQEYNQLKFSEWKKREELLRKLFGKIGEEILIEPNFYCDYGYNIEIGNNFYANHNLIILDGAKVTIGNHVFIAPNCGLYTAGHPMETKLRNEGIEYAKPITIEDHVWIGGNVVVLPGVTIGNNTVIGAGSVVTKDITDHVVAFGNPCKVMKELREK